MPLGPTVLKYDLSSPSACTMLSVHKKWREDYNRKEAQWKRSIAYSHSIFCGCPSYLLHFNKKCHSTGDGGAGLDEVVSPGEGISFVTESTVTGGEEDHGGSEKGDHAR
nr:MAG: ORF2 [Torque teno polar bear virus 20]